MQPYRGWEPPEAERELVREGEVRAAQMRVVVTGAGAVTVLLALSFPTRIYINGYALLLMAGFAELLLLRGRAILPRWLSTVSCLFDITVLNAMNAAFVLDERLYDAKQAGRGRITLPPETANGEQRAAAGSREA
jgi:hypothetical protein